MSTEQGGDALSQILHNLREMRKQLDPSGTHEATPEELESLRTAAQRGDADAAFQLWGVLRWEPADHFESLQWLRVAADAGHEKAMFELARHLSDEDKEEAERLYRELGDDFEDADVVALELGRILESRGETDEAEAWYRKAVSYDVEESYAPKEAAPLLADILLRRDDLDGAEPLLRLAADQGAIVSQIRLSRVQFLRGDYEAAESSARQPAELGWEGAMHVLGHALIEQGNTTEGERWLGKAVRDGYLRSALALGYSLGNRGEYLKAKRRFNQAAKAEEPDIAEAAAEGLRWLAEIKNGGTQEQVDVQLTGVEAEPAAASEPEVAELDEAFAELQALIGLGPVKEAVRSYVNVVKNQQLRRALGLKTASRSNHLVFVGPPGTGKTTVARLLGRIFCALGVLEHGDVVEVARADLVAEYLGQTAVRTNEVIDKALGGVLFIDEAYTLIPETSYGDSYGKEAVETLMKRMEDERDKFVLIAAGYETPMNRFLAANPGLRSRFDETIDFPHYEPPDLLRVLAYFAEREDYELTPDAEAKAASVLEEAWHKRDETFGNARLVRNLFEDAIRAQANRLEGEAAPDAETLRRLEVVDIPNTA